uniref:Uncharacterized protein n=1 Tax=Arundo donax TaxID=35708 RepID=A0A0A9FLB5_ARUDO
MKRSNGGTWPTARLCDGETGWAGYGSTTALEMTVRRQRYGPNVDGSDAAANGLARSLAVVLAGGRGDDSQRWHKDEQIWRGSPPSSSPPPGGI